MKDPFDPSAMDEDASASGPNFSTPPMAAVSPGSYAIADYGARLGGWILDWLLLGIVSALVCDVTGQVHRFNTTQRINGGDFHNFGFHVTTLGVVMWAIVTVAYGTVMIGLRGQTIGMLATKVRAVDATTGGVIGYPRAFARGAVEMLLFVFFFVPWVLDMVWPIWQQRNQTLHDLATKTVVIRL
jgi:uncharacterized RDD family membrane protein YckC